MKQKWVIKLEITQECTERMTPREMRDWIAAHFEGCDYGRVDVKSASVEVRPLRGVRN